MIHYSLIRLVYDVTEAYKNELTTSVSINEQGLLRETSHSTNRKCKSNAYIVEKVMKFKKTI